MGLASARVFGAQMPDLFLPVAWPTQIRTPFSTADRSLGKFLPNMRWSDVYI